MPIDSIPQPDILPIGSDLRLRKFSAPFGFALAWYRDPETVWMVDGVRIPYTPEKLERMYRWLDTHGELYWIEILQDGVFVPVGDVTLCREDLPIVIGVPSCRGKGIGSRVIGALLSRAKTLGFPAVFVREIYDWNPASARLFERCGFEKTGRTEKGNAYRKWL